MSFLGNLLGVAGKAASLIPGVGTLGGAVLSGFGSALGSSVNQADDRDYSMQLWNAQNAYNAPSAQADRLRKAGLNPNMLMGPNVAGQATTMPDTVKVSDSNSNNHDLDSILAMMTLASQLKVNDSVVNRNNSEVPVNQLS